MRHAPEMGKFVLTRWVVVPRSVFATEFACKRSVPGNSYRSQQSRPRVAHQIVQAVTVRAVAQHAPRISYFNIMNARQCLCVRMWALPLRVWSPTRICQLTRLILSCSSKPAYQRGSVDYTYMVDIVGNLLMQKRKNIKYAHLETLKQ